MRIAEIAIEGFKSYGDKVRLGPFGSRFTAICGANGSGKSNLFDAICFAMGFRIGPDMRADNLSDLIYQRGQSGITSAHVTIVFDNSDKKTSPAQYYDCDTIKISRQVALRGRERYFINGELKRVSDLEKLLKEARLNPRSPEQFVIMQGKIQEIVKQCMKGQLMHHLEACVGTSLFDKEKEKSQKTLNDKDLQLKSIENDLVTLLEPALQRARDERANYLRWLDLGKILTALKAYQALTKKQSLEVQLADCELRSKPNTAQEAEDHARIQGLKAEYKNCETRCQVLDQDTLTQCKKKATIAESAGKAEQQVNRALSAFTCKSDELNSLMSLIKQLNADLTKKTKTLATFRNNNAQFVEQESMLKKATEQAAVVLQKAAIRVDKARRGDWTDSEGRELKEATDLLNSRRADLNSELSGVNIQIEHNEKEIQRLKGSEDKGEIQGLKEKELHWQNVKRTAEEKLAALNFDAAAEDDLQRQLTSLRQDEEQLEERLRILGQRFVREERIKSKFTDRKQVPGVLLDVFHVKDDRFNLALEEAAKSRLFHVVVDNDETATELFKWASNHGIRVTCLPINKLNNQPAPPALIERAKREARADEEVYYSLDVVDYDTEFTACLCSAFNVFLTTSMSAAKRVGPYHDITSVDQSPGQMGP